MVDGVPPSRIQAVCLSNARGASGVSAREMKPPACCAPERRGTSASPALHVPTNGVAENPQASGLVELDGGSFSMGAEDAEGFLEDGEGPVREVELSPFAIEAHAVTNRRFADFVDATGHSDGRRALRLVVRVRGPAAGQLSRHARRRRRTVVAAGLRSDLALSRGPAIRDRGQTRSPRRTRLVARRRGLLRLGAAAASDRGRVGVRRTRRVGPRSAFRGAMSESPGESTG